MKRIPLEETVLYLLLDRARVAGTTVEIAIRALHRFERAGGIDAGMGWVKIRDPEAPERVSGGETAP